MEANIILGLIALFGLTLAIGKKEAEKLEKQNSNAKNE